MIMYLVNHVSKDLRKNSYPLGLAYIAASIETYLPVKIFDFHFGDNENDFIDSLMKNDASLVGFSLCSGEESIREVIRLARVVKSLSPKSLVGVGGPHPSAIGMDFLKKHMEIDIAFYGAGEESIACVAKNISSNHKFYADVPNIAYRDENNNIIKSNYRHRKICKSINPARHLLPGIFEFAKKNNQRIPVLYIDFSRGCVGQCSFCGLSIDEKIRWNPRNIASIEEEIRHTIKNNNISSLELFITDADFLCSKKRAKKLLTLLSNFDEVTNFSIAARTDSIIKSDELMDDLFNAGCTYIEVGVESNSMSQLERYNKRVTPEVNSKAISLLKKYQKKYGFKFQIDIIVFEPFVSMKEVIMSFDFINKHFYGDIQNEKAIFNRMILFPNTVYREKTIKAGLACESSEAELPYWMFKNQDVSHLYSIIHLYELMIQKRKETLLELVSKKIERIKEIQKNNLKDIKNIRMLHTMNYNFISEILNTDNGMFIDVFNRYENQLSEIEKQYID